MATEIKKKPTKTLKSLSTPARGANGSYVMSADFNLGDALVSTKSETRASHMRYGWRIVTSGTSLSITDAQTIKAANKKFTKTINLNSVLGKTRSSFYPYTGLKVYSVSIWAQPYNKYGDGAIVMKTRQFKAPAKPKIGAFTVTDENGIVSVTITSGDGDGYAERAYTRYKVVISDTYTGKTWTHSDGKFTGNSYTASYNVSDYQQLAYGDYVQITVTAWNQGFVGDSAQVSSTYYMSYPAQASISDVKVSSREATGKCTVEISTNSSTLHPVDKVELEYLANCVYATAGSIPGDESWTASNIVDDAACTALAMPVASLIPDAGKYTWVRVKSTHAIESVLFRYSEPKRVKGLETPAPSASDDEIKILSTALGVDRESVLVHMGWDKDGTDDSTGTELSWADAEDAWKSTEPPDTFEFDWSDGAYTDTSVTPNVTYNQSAEITIKGLDPGQNVYIRARRYLDLNGERTYGTYCNAKTQIPSSEITGEPESVSLSLPGFVARGNSALASWTLGSPNEQLTWSLMTDDGVTIAEGAGIASSYQIPPERLESLAVNDALAVVLQVSTGGDPITSDTKALVIVDAPTVSVTVSSTIATQPLSFALACNKAATIVASIVASGISGQNAAGMYEQFAGDTVWSDVIEPEWTIVSDSSYTTTITLENQEFYDDAAYTLNIQAVDSSTGLKSEIVSNDFTIEWNHQAIAADDSTVTAGNYYDADGVHHMEAEIAIVAPDGAGQTDVYDIYRYTSDGAALIGAGYADGATLVDKYAPFGAGMDLYYRIATRTVDGDEEYADIPYELDGRVLRFDWSYGSLELPYNIDISDSYKKSTSERTHKDGVNNVYWNKGAKRTAKYSSQLIRLDSQEDIEAARQLARYPGAVFVRTPDGSAFPADVQINEMSTSGVIQVFSLSITEIALTDEFMLMDYEEPEEEEPEE